ncbi:ATP-binding protein [Gemmatimonadota bacterium]
MANTVTKLEILSYFQQHPFAMDNAGGVAGWLNRSADDVSLDLGELAATRVIVRDDGARDAVYSYDPQGEQAELAARAVDAFNLTRDTVYEEVLARQRDHEQMRRQYQQLLDTEKGKTETILNSLAEAVVVTDRQGRVLTVNEPFLSAFATDRERFTPGDSIRELAASAEISDVISRAVDTAGGGSIDFTSVNCHYVVSSRPVTDGTGRVVEDGEGQSLATVTVFRDVTGEREMEQMREDFVRMLSHDLKNPLGIIYGSSTLVLDGKLGMLNEKQTKLLGNVVKCCGQMEKLIEDFLTLSRLEAGQLVLNTQIVDLGSVVDGVVEISRSQFEQRELTGLYHPPAEKLEVLADLVQLERVVSNLVGNAVKYNRDGGRVDVFCSREGGAARVEVADTGLGIPADEVSLIFDKFRRSAAVERMKGSGLGLTICRDLIEAMGGSISAQSVEGQGSRFIFTIPLANETD